MSRFISYSGGAPDFCCHQKECHKTRLYGGKPYYRIWGAHEFCIPPSTYLQPNKTNLLRKKKPQSNYSHLCHDWPLGPSFCHVWSLGPRVAGRQELWRMERWPPLKSPQVNSISHFGLELTTLAFPRSTSLCLRSIDSIRPAAKSSYEPVVGKSGTQVYSLAHNEV